MNQFSDWTDEEYGAILGERVSRSKSGSKHVMTTKVPSEWNWITQGAVSPVKNQG